MGREAKYVVRLTGLEATLSRRPMSSKRPTKLDGAKQSRLIAIACGPAPEGRARWTLWLLADKLVELEVVDSIGTEAVRRTLKKRAKALAESTVGDPSRAKRRPSL